ncbi:MAG: DNA-binding protein [Chloroflexi bacterium]|nr:DNA-binding protein [Chloroflexota bacterium]
MSTITVVLPDDRLIQLRELATRLGIAPEDLARASIEDLLSQPDEAFQKAAEKVLSKNADLYKRLAAQ